LLLPYLFFVSFSVFIFSSLYLISLWLYLVTNFLFLCLWFFFSNFLFVGPTLRHFMFPLQFRLLLFSLFPCFVHGFSSLIYRLCALCKCISMKANVMSKFSPKSDFLILLFNWSVGWSGGIAPRILNLGAR
jgi:hypothetical protein